MCEIKEEREAQRSRVMREEQSREVGVGGVGAAACRKEAPSGAGLTSNGGLL